MSTPVVYIALLLHCIGKNANLLICFWKNASNGGGGGLGLLKFFVASPEWGFRLLLAFQKIVLMLWINSPHAFVHFLFAEVLIDFCILRCYADDEC